MGNVIDDVDASDLLLLQEEHSLAFLLAEDGDEHICAADLALARALHVEDRTLQYALKTKRGLGFALHIVFGYQRCGRINEFSQLPPQPLHVGSTCAHDGYRCLIVQERKQQVLYRHEFVAFVAGFLER